MGIGAHFIIAIKSLLRRPWRSLVVLQGIIWGVALTVFPASLREGAHNQARLRAEEFGIDRISIQAYYQDEGGALTLSDCDAVRDAFGPAGGAPQDLRVLACAPIVRKGLWVGRYRDTTPDRMDVLFTTPDSQEARSFHVARGRYLVEDDISNARRVCVMEVLAAEKLFGKEDPIGKTVLIQQGLKMEPFEVVGVMEKRSEERLGTDDYGFKRKEHKNMVEKLTRPLGLKRPDQSWKRSEKALHVPLLSSRGVAVTEVDWILIRGARWNNTQELKKALNDFLVERGRTVAVYGNIFYPMLLESERHTYGVLYLAILIICLLMSGLAIINTMLITVMERSREIAIRRTEGASRRHIAAQFLLESAMMCGIGAAIGLPAGLGLAWANLLLRPRYHALSAIGLPWATALPTIGIAMVVGILAGALPAARAASVDPVVILSRRA